MERFGKFQLLERIGVGGMAEIYLARPSDAALSKLVAVKRILPKHSRDSSFIDMFKSEGEIALRLRHPSIIMVNEMGTANGQYYMAMEFFPGKTLAQLMLNLRNHNLALDITEKLFIIRNVADALQYIHDFTAYGDNTEIIHRDISPQNILIGFDGGVKLIDFGVAKIIDKNEETRTSLLKGKMAYMSPEQIRGDKLTKQTDVFSLGVVLWEVLAGRKLFTGATFEDVALKVEKCEVPSLLSIDSSIPQMVDTICRRALARDTKYRYANSKELFADLDKALRSFKLDGHQKRVARSLQKVFADEFSHLQEILKKHEGEKRPIVPTSIPEEDAPKRPAVHQMIAPPQPIKSAGNGSSAKKGLAAPPKQRPPQKNGSGSWLVNGVVFLLGIACVVYIAVQLQKNPVLFGGEANPSVASADLHEEPMQQTVRPAPQHPIEHVAESVRTPAPIPQPALAQVAPKPSPIAVVRPMDSRLRRSAQPPPVAPTPPALTLQKKPAAAQSPIAVLPAKAPAKRKPAQAKAPSTPARKKGSANENERNPAAIPPIKSFAYLTVFADPNAKIMIDGKLVGTEIVSDHKVPSDKKLIVKVIGKSGKSKTQQLTLKPFSRNVVDMALEVE